MPGSRASPTDHAALAAALRQRLPSGVLSWRPAEGGRSIWCRLRGGTDAVGLLQRAEADGVTFVPGEPFYGDGLGRHELRLAFAGVRPPEIDEGVRRLARALAGGQDGAVAGRQALV